MPAPRLAGRRWPAPTPEPVIEVGIRRTRRASSTARCGSAVATFHITALPRETRAALAAGNTPADRPGGGTDRSAAGDRPRTVGANPAPAAGNQRARPAHARGQGSPGHRRCGADVEQSGEQRAGTRLADRFPNMGRTAIDFRSCACCRSFRIGFGSRPGRAHVAFIRNQVFLVRPSWPRSRDGRAVRVVATDRCNGGRAVSGSAPKCRFGIASSR